MVSEFSELVPCPDLPQYHSCELRLRCAAGGCDEMCIRRCCALVHLVTMSIELVYLRPQSVLQGRGVKIWTTNITFSDCGIEPANLIHITIWILYLTQVLQSTYKICYLINTRAPHTKLNCNVQILLIIVYVGVSWSLIVCRQLS